MEAVGEALQARLHPVDADRRSDCRRSPPGMAANRPSAVANRASAMPGATTASEVLCSPAMSVKLRMIPQTVPNRPTKGATEPTVARMLSRAASRSVSAATAECMATARRERVPSRSTRLAGGRAAPFGDAGGEHLGARAARSCRAPRRSCRYPRLSRNRARTGRSRGGSRRIFAPLADDDRPGPDAGEEQADHHDLDDDVGLQEQGDGDIRSLVADAANSGLLPSSAARTPRPRRAAGASAVPPATGRRP